ncbi:MAG: hypothetical protein ACE5D8_03620 [Fidelibacterota bacterium]
MVRIISSTLRQGILVLISLAGLALGQIAIVVHPDNPIESISREELEHFYNGSLTQFPDGTTVVLVEHNPTADRFYQILLNKSYIKVKKQWIRYVFSGRTANPPEEISNTLKLQEFVLANRGAIAFLPYEDVTINVKFLAVDGHNVSHEHYLFADTKLFTQQP